jgi:aerobic carbon-monoxide dehydrogenase large subunit
MSDKQSLPTGLQLTAMDPVFRERPHEYLDRLRTEDPVHRDAELGRLFLTRFEEVRAPHVAVDPGTGDVELLDCLVVEDVGRIVNPLTLHGRAIGGIVQGLGGAFLEHLVYDANGQLLAGNLADYLIPAATDFPKIRAIALENHRSPSNPLGVKGAGEGAIIPIGGLMANAVANALASFGAAIGLLPPGSISTEASAKSLPTARSEDRR